jgi:alpha-glucosidase
MKPWLAAACLCAAFVLGASAHAQDLSPLTSPNGRIEIRFGADGATYEVRFDGRPVIAPSPLGLDVQGAPLSNLHLAGQARTTGEHAYRLVAGKTSAVRAAYAEATLSLREAAAPERQLDLIFRAYDDGVAFRHRLRAQPGASPIAIAGERTRFDFARDYGCWGFNVGRFGSSHEGEFDPVRAADIRAHNLFDLPLVCQDADVAFAIAEADLENYAGLYLAGRGDGGLGVEARLSPRLDDPTIAVRARVDADGVATPWRVVMIADTPGRLIESNLIASLSPAPAFDTSWVRPGRSAWDWWSGSQAAVAQPGMNTQTMRAYVDFAAANGLEYVLIDDGWFVGAHGATPAAGADILRPVPELDLPGLIAYARARNVRVWLWMHWRLLDARMEETLAAYRSWGVAGVKVDYMDRDDQEMVDFYHRLLNRAAEHRLMINLHGAYPPRGLARTYPHFLTQEGVLGAEYNKWSRRITARHNVTLAYTRMLLGPMDYTPGAMRNTTPEAFQVRFIRPEVMTTRAHGLAMYVVYESPFVAVADSPDSYAGQAGLDFLRMVPATWDETRFLAGEIGEYIALARRRGDIWYVGAMTNESAREIDLPLGFLGAGRFRADIWADGDTPIAIQRSQAIVSAAAPLRLRLAANGGAVVRLRR